MTVAVSSIVSPPSGENERGGSAGGILRHEHRKRTRYYPLLAVRNANYTQSALLSFRPVVFVLDDTEEMKHNVSESGEISQH